MRQEMIPENIRRDRRTTLDRLLDFDDLFGDLAVPGSADDLTTSPGPSIARSLGYRDQYERPRDAAQRGKLMTQEPVTLRPPEQGASAMVATSPRHAQEIEARAMHPRKRQYPGGPILESLYRRRDQIKESLLNEAKQGGGPGGGDDTYGPSGRYATMWRGKNGILYYDYDGDGKPDKMRYPGGDGGVVEVYDTDGDGFFDGNVGIGHPGRPFYRPFTDNFVRPVYDLDDQAWNDDILHGPHPLGPAGDPLDHMAPIQGVYGYDYMKPEQTVPGTLNPNAPEELFDMPYQQA
jgi:hypothetical protein